MSQRQGSWLAPLPLCAAYLAGPLALLAGRLVGRPETFGRFGPKGLAPWMLLAGAALFYSLWARAMARVGEERPAWPTALVGALLAGITILLVRRFGPLVAQAEDLAALLDELRLPALALFAALWTWTFGPVRRKTMRILGAILGAALSLDFLLTAIMARRLVPGGGYLFGAGQNVTDLLAFLLCLALAATLDGPDARHVQPPAPPRPRITRWLIMAGLFASFSLSGLAAAGLMLLLLDRRPLRERVALFCACVLVLWLSLTLPLPRMGQDEGDLGLVWYATATAEAVQQAPHGLFTGLPLNEPMALAMPDFQGVEWDPDSAGLPVSVHQIPSSLLRLLAAWGLGGPLAVLGAALACVIAGARRAPGRGRFGAGVYAAMLAAGALSPVLHTPATAAALVLALALALTAVRPAGEADPQENVKKTGGQA